MPLFGHDAGLAVHDGLAGFIELMINRCLIECVLMPLQLITKGHKKILLGGILWTTVISSTGQPSFD